MYAAAGLYTSVYSAANGCDSIVQFQLAVSSPYLDTLDISLCQGDSIFAAGAWQTMSGTYVESMTSAFGCDSTVVTNVQVYPTYFSRDTVQLCFGDSVYLAGAWQSIPGLYTSFDLTAQGCDSTQETLLQVRPLASSLTILEICAGDSVFAAGSWQNSSGTYTDVYSAANGCDSLSRTQLLVLPQAIDTVVVEICDGNAYYAGGAWQTAAGLYVDHGVGPDGCSSATITDLRVNAVYSETRSYTICAGDSLFAAGAWQNASGLFTELYSTVQGCDSIINYDIVVLPLNIQTNTVAICEGDSVFAAGSWQSVSCTYSESFLATSGCDSTIVTDLQVIARYVEDISVQLCDGNFFIVGNDTVTSTGLYPLIFTAASGCDSILRYDVEFLPLDQIEESLVICEGDSVFFAEEWFTEAGIYVDTVAQGSGCPELHILVLEVRIGAQIFAPDTVICEGDRVQLIATGASTYFWSPATGLSCTDCPDPWVDVQSTTLYTVTTTDACFANPTAESLVEVMPRPTVDAGSDQAIAPGQSITLVGDGVGNGPLLYWWEVDGQRVCTDCPEWTLVPSAGAEYTVWVEDGLGCVASDRVSIEVDNSCVDGRFDAANAFTPNADGFNDEFVIRYNGPATVDRIRIYNRWGELLFETEDPEVHWNGIFRNKLLDPGVYVYYMEGICEDNQKFLHVGNVTLVR